MPEHESETAKTPAALSALTARPAPEWLTRGVLYQIWLRSFTPEGTLRAATERLPSVAELGANVLYLSPIALADDDMRPEFWSKRQIASGTNNPRNPYRIKDYNRVDPEYGDEDDLRAFVTAAHGLGMRVLLDLVYFHCGPTSTLIEHPEFFQRTPDGGISTGNWNFPVLNFENGQLREYLWASMEHWVRDFDVDGYRLDVSDPIPLDFWEEARERLDRLKDDIVILGEGERAADQVRAMDINYSFTWYNALSAVFARGLPASSLRATWEKMAGERPRGARFIRYTENHDIVNDERRADVVFSERGANALAVVNFTLDGVPLLYNGQEIGDTNRQSIFARWPVGWEAAPLPGARARRELFGKLCRLRRTEAALNEGAVEWLDNDRPDMVVSFERRAGAERTITVANLSNRPIRVRISLPDGASAAGSRLLSDGAEIAEGTDGLTVELAGFGYFVGKQA